MPPLAVDTVTSSDGFAALRPLWNRLLMRSDADTVFLTHEWLATWWDSFGEDNDLLALVVRRGEEPVALAPLMLTPARGNGQAGREIRFLANAYSMRSGFVLADAPGPALEAIFDQLSHSGLSWRGMTLNYLPEDSSAAKLSRAVCRRAGLRCGAVESLISPFRSLEDADWDQILASLRHSFRKNLLYCERRLIQRESARVVVCDGREGLEHALEAVRRISLTTWQHEYGSSLVSSPKVWGFYRRLAEVAADRGWLRLGVLERAAEPIAFEYNLLYHGVMYNLKVGYRPDTRKHSPGHVLKAHMIRRALDEGAIEYDLLGANEGYKLEWASGERRHTCLCIAGPGRARALAHWFRFEAGARLRASRPAVALKHWLAARRAADEAPVHRWQQSR